MNARFVLDSHLGKLARHLRMIGVDTAWHELESESDEETLKREAADEGRVLLTQDQELHDRADPLLRHLVVAVDPNEQLLEVLERFGMVEFARSGKGFLSRCLHCNSMILPAQPFHVADRIPGHLLLEHDKFYLCPRCERVSWDGTHVERMKAWVAKLVAQA